MSFGTAGRQAPFPRAASRVSRAQWWFRRMRQVVDRAIDWQPAPVPPPEQIWFAGIHGRMLTSTER